MNALLHIGTISLDFFNLIFSKCEKVLLLKLIYIKSDPLIKLSTDFSDLYYENIQDVVYPIPAVTRNLTMCWSTLCVDSR